MYLDSFGGKLFRIGGDEARLHFPTQERANGFVKEIRQRLAQSPSIKSPDGKDTGHIVSASIGMGYTPEHAEQALIHAKERLGPLVQGKRQKYKAPGQEETVAHSLLHESPPPHWRPSTGKLPTLPHETPTSVTEPGLQLQNPLKHF